MAIKVSSAIVQTYDGHNINDGVLYKAYIGADVSHPPTGKVIAADIDNDWSQFVGTERNSKAFSLYIFVVDASEWHERANELRQWFNTQIGEEQYLVALFDGSVRRIACRPTAIKFDGRMATITLTAQSPFWEDNEVNTETWAITASGQTKIITNVGNTRVSPVLKFKMTSAPKYSWRYQRPVSVKNNVMSALTNYPLEITGGGWNTAALVANASKTTTLNSNISAAATTIPVADTSGLYSYGLVYIGTEQIYYASKNAGNLLGCVRGVGGTTAATHNSGDTAYQSECFADGRDIRVYSGNTELPRWFGAAAGASKGPNYNNTLIWTVIPSLPARASDYSGGELVTLGSNLARDCDAVASTETDGNPAGNVTDGSMSKYWKALTGTKTGNIVIDLGAQVKINRVRIRVPNSNEAPKNYTVQTSTDGSSYTTQTTVTGSTAMGIYRTYDFAETTCRYVKIDVTEIQTGGTTLAIVEVEVYCIAYQLTIRYGNPVIANYALADTTKPMFRLDTSTNSSWDYDDFYDESNTARTGAWSPVSYQSQTVMRAYKTLHAGTEANPAAVLGVAYKASGTKVYRDGFKLTNPCKFSVVVHSGYTKQNPNYRRWRLLGMPASGNPVVEYEITTNSASAWTAYGPITTTLSASAVSVVFYHWLKAASSSANYAEATDVTLTIVSPPTVTLQAATFRPSTVRVAAQVYNQTAGQSVFVNGIVQSNVNLVVDVENFDVYHEGSNQREPSIVSIEPGAVRTRWLELLPGANTLQYKDTSVVGITVTFEWRNRYL